MRQRAKQRSHVLHAAATSVRRGSSRLAKENAAGHAQNDAGKAKNSSDLLKAREANLKYEVDDLGTTFPGSKTLCAEGLCLSVCASSPECLVPWCQFNVSIV